MAQEDLHNLFHDGLRYTYYADGKILSNLRKLARAAEADEILNGFETHLEETEGQIERLQQLFQLLDKPARGKTDPAIDAVKLIEQNEQEAADKMADDKAALVDPA